MTKARDIMSGGTECVGENETLVDAARKMRDLDIGSLPICGEDNRLKGMLTDRDIVVKCIADGGDPSSSSLSRRRSRQARSPKPAHPSDDLIRLGELAGGDIQARRQCVPQAGPRHHIQFREDPVQMARHCARANEEPGGDVLVRQARGSQGCHLTLLGSEFASERLGRPVAGVPPQPRGAELMAHPAGPRVSAECLEQVPGASQMPPGFHIREMPPQPLPEEVLHPRLLERQSVDSVDRERIREPLLGLFARRGEGRGGSDQEP